MTLKIGNLTAYNTCKQCAGIQTTRAELLRDKTYRTHKVSLIGTNYCRCWHHYYV